MDTETGTGLVADWRERVVAEVTTWLGTPYIPKARVKGVGTDCGGLLYQVYNPIFGPFAPFPTDYPADWALHSNRERYLDFIMPYVKEVSQPSVGGFSLFHLGLVYAHAAIYVGDNQYIHAWGRQREGSVTKTPARVMRAMAKGQVKHFDPVGTCAS